MTGEEVHGFALRRAFEASQSIPMDNTERAWYVAVIESSIQYFNSRSVRHADHMRYLSECKRERERKERERVSRKKPFVSITIY